MCCWLGSDLVSRQKDKNQFWAVVTQVQIQKQHQLTDAWRELLSDANWLVLYIHLPASVGPNNVKTSASAASGGVTVQDKARIELSERQM